MLEKLSKSSVSFMMTILKRPIHSYNLETKISFHLRENQLQSKSLDHEKHFKSHIRQNNPINPFLPLYIEETYKPYMHQRIK